MSQPRSCDAEWVSPSYHFSIVHYPDIFRSLDELDEDLLLELNQVVHENQLAYLPFARSGRAEALLFDQYPELAEKIERGKRAKIDAIVLSNKYADVDSLSASFRAQSLEEISASPLRQRTRRRASREVKSPALGPLLKGKGSIQDLMFEMSDGEDDGLKETGKIKPPQFIDHASTDPLGSPESPWATVTKQIRSPKGFDKGDDIPMKSITPLPPPAMEQKRVPSQPWGNAPLASTKLDLRDIMAQATPSTPSNLTLGLSKKETNQKFTASHAKLSQKERKKLQQAQNLGSAIEKPQPAPPAVSPWQAMSHRKPSNSPTVSPALQASPKPSPQPSRTSSTPQLTMRQTVANKGPASKKKKDKEATTVVESNASGSGQASQKRPSANERGMSVSTDPIPTPRSVRHIPLPQHSPTSPSQNMSMMEILSLQEAEKASIRDAAAKRSLQEIQQEQEFQAWWDEESKRVIQEEERRKRTEERTTRTAARGRGGKPRGGRGGKNKPKTEQDDRGKQSKNSGQNTPTPDPASSSTKPPPKVDGAADTTRGKGRPHRGNRGGARGPRPQRDGHSTPSASAQT